MEHLTMEHFMHLDNAEPTIPGGTHKGCILKHLIGNESPVGVEGGMRVGYFEYEPTGSTEPHRHDQEEQAYFLLEGLMTVTVDGSEYDLTPGGIVHIPLNAEHSYAPVGEGCKFLIICAPVAFLEGYQNQSD